MDGRGAIRDTVNLTWRGRMERVHQVAVRYENQLMPRRA